MAVELLLNRHKPNPNEKVHSLYHGVSAYGGTVTALTKVAADGNHLETTRVYGAPLARGQGGQIATLILGGLETSLDEMLDILETKKHKKFVPKRADSDIVKAIRKEIDRRNDAIRYFKKNPSEVSRDGFNRVPKKKKVVMYLPVGYRMKQTSVPGLQLRVRA